MNADGTENGMMGVLQSRNAEVSATGVRYVAERMDHAHFLFQTWAIEVSFFFRVPEETVGPMRSHFAEPLGSSCWVCVAASSLLLTIALTLATIIQRRRQVKLSPEIGSIYGCFAVIAALCQQVFEVGPSSWKTKTGDKTRPYSAVSESGMEPRYLSGRMVYFVTFMFSLLLYNYYTSSVVSSLLSAPPRVLGGLEELVSGPLELIFEDIGYTRTLFDNPNYSFQPTRKKLEKFMVATKVKTTNRKMPIFLNPTDGIELVRKGGYAYQTEPETAYPLIADTFDQDEICDLQAIAMLEAPIFFAVQKNSPLKEIFMIGLIRLREQGHSWRAERLFQAATPKCDGLGGRALPVPLGRAAPAILITIIGGVVSLVILGLEFAHARYMAKKFYGRKIIIQEKINKYWFFTDCKKNP